MAKKIKTKHFKYITLNEDFGNNLKGEKIRLEATLAARLIYRGVAVEGEVTIIEEPKKIEVKSKEVKPKTNKKTK